MNYLKMISYKLVTVSYTHLPTLVTGGLLGQIVGLLGVEYGVIEPENVSYVMLISMSAFLVAVIRTPLTAIVLITEITGHFEVFYPSVVVGGLTYYFTELLQIKPFNVTLYEDMINTCLLYTSGAGMIPSTWANRQPASNDSSCLMSTASIRPSFNSCETMTPAPW